MKKWYLVGSMGGMKMLYFIGQCESESEAKEKAIIRYKLKKNQINNIKLESKDI
jgi:hypothetical protein